MFVLCATVTACKTVGRAHIQGRPVHKGPGFSPLDVLIAPQIALRIAVVQVLIFSLPRSACSCLQFHKTVTCEGSSDKCLDCQHK